MAASQNDYFTYVGSPGNATTLASPGHTIGGTSINVGSTSNWNTVSGQFFAIDRVTVVNGVQTQVPGTYTVWEAVVSGPTSVTNMVLRYGTDQNYSAGSTTRVYIVIASARENRVIDGILMHANQDGSLKQAAVTAGVANDSISTAKIASGAVTTEKMLAATISGAMNSLSPVPTGKTPIKSVNLPVLTSAHKFQIIVNFAPNHTNDVVVRDYSGSIFVNAVDIKAATIAMPVGAYNNALIPIVCEVTSGPTGGDLIEFTINRSNDPGGLHSGSNSSYMITDLGKA